jgi:DNA polymerase I
MRGVAYANHVLDANLEPGDVVAVVPLERVHPVFFERVETERDLNPREDPLYGEFKRNPDVVAVRVTAGLPDEFHIAVDRNGGDDE